MMNPNVNPANNRLSTSDGYLYDTAGNTTRDSQNRRFTYDAENKQTKVEQLDSTGGVTNVLGQYDFDGDGKRVKKIVPGTGEVTVFVYDASGRTVAEYSTIVANTETAQVSYMTADHLGSPRVITDALGKVTSRRDFQPFGEEVNAVAAAPTARAAAQKYTQPDNVRQKFTTYERDEEIDLDYAQARMYGRRSGRFTSPDPLLTSGRPPVPMTWNCYVYTLNNPLIYADPTGLWEWSRALGGSFTDKELTKQRTKAKKEKNDSEYKRLDGILKKRKAFVDGLASAKAEAEKISDQKDRETVKATLATYGKPQDGNAVTVAEIDSSSGNSAVFTKFEDGRYIVAFSESEFSDDTLSTSIAHEGYHLANIVIDRFFMALGAQGYATTVHNTEKGAYRISSLIEQANGKGTYSVMSPKGGTVIWDSAWSELDEKAIEANRSSAIENHLRNLGIGENDRRGKEIAFPGGGKWR